MLVCVGNYTIVVLTVLAFSLGFVTNASPLLIRIPFIFFAIYTTFIFFPALAGLCIGIGELRSRSDGDVSLIAVLGNLTLMVGWVILVAALWPALMSV